MLSIKELAIMALWAILAFVIVALSILEVAPDVRSNYSNFLNSAAALTAGVFCYRAAFGFPKGNLMRSVWATLASGVLLWGVGELIYAQYMLANNGAETPYPYWTDIFFLGFIVLSVIGLLLFKIRSGLSTPLWGKILALLVLVGSLVFSWALDGLSGEGLEFAVSCAYAVLDSLLFALVVLIFSGLFGGRAAAGWWYMLAGISTYVIANKIYNWMEYNSSYASGSMLDILWVIGFGLIAIAAMVAFAQFSGKNKG